MQAVQAEQPKKKPAKNHKFDFRKLEAEALDSWIAWDKHDTQEARTEMFSRIKDLTVAVIHAGEFERKFKIRLGDDPDAKTAQRIDSAAYEYSVYLFERLVTRSKTLQPKEDVVEMIGGAAEPKDDIGSNDNMFLDVTNGKYYKKQSGKWSLQGKTSLRELTLASAAKLIKRHVKQEITVKSVHPAPGGNFLVSYRWHRFALQPYINQNLRHVLLQHQEDYGAHELIETLEASLQSGKDLTLETSPTRNPSERFTSDYLAKKVFRGLRMFYDKPEIDRLYGLACELVYHNERGILESGAPKDVADFALVLLGLSKRVARENSIISASKVSKRNFNQALETAVRSSIFLSSVVNAKFFDRELLLSMDLESLYRLSTLMGGKKVTVPTVRELDTLVGAVSAISDAMIKAKDPEKALRESKANLGLVFSHKINLKKFIHQALEAHSLFGEDKNSVPLVNLLLSSISCIEKTFEGLADKSRQGSTGELAQTYLAMVEASTSFANALSNISSGGRKALGETK